MKLSAAIMAHPKREAMVEELQQWLDRPVPVVWDKINDRHDTGGRAVEAFDPTATHHMVIQDDVVPCRDLLAGVEQAVAHVPPECPVSLYIGRVRPFARAVTNVTERADGASWITMKGIYWGPAIVFPTCMIPDLMSWYWRAKITNYDRRCSKWFERKARRCWYTWPNLVEHRGDDSLAHGTVAERRSHWFAGADASALDIDWSGPVVDMLRTDRMDAERQRRAKR